ncbi:hypothetical protein MFLAVUS_000076 [Mucor flavus]|uniref:Uncharacterized protein n=1 Tax=Mucor flavus TaxID=439312 RepID=A0ABP9YIP5_9FUNG
MDEYFFNDERYLQYFQEAIEHQPMPQYIICLKEEALKHPEVIYISSDEETEEEDIDKTTLTGNDANIRVAPKDERVTGADAGGFMNSLKARGK